MGVGVVFLPPGRRSKMVCIPPEEWTQLSVLVAVVGSLVEYGQVGSPRRPLRRWFQRGKGHQIDCVKGAVKDKTGVDHWRMAMSVWVEESRDGPGGWRPAPRKTRIEDYELEGGLVKVKVEDSPGSLEWERQLAMSSDEWEWHSADGGASESDDSD